MRGPWSSPPHPPTRPAPRGRIMERLQHGGVLRALGTGESSEGRPFLVLERLKAVLSSTLPKAEGDAPYWERRSAVKRWPLARALQVGLELAEVNPSPSAAQRPSTPLP